MSLYDLLTILPAGSAFGGAIAASGVHQATGVGKAALIGLGVIVAVMCVVVVRMVGARVIARFYKPSEDGSLSKSQTSALRMLYLGAAGWIVASGVLGYQVVAFAM